MFSIRLGKDSFSIKVQQQNETEIKKKSKNKQTKQTKKPRHKSQWEVLIHKEELHSQIVLWTVYVAES